METSVDVDVLVVGAGPTGLVLASELARHGAHCRLIDKTEAASDKSKAIGIQARTLEMFDAMGIVEEFTARGVQMQAMNMISNGHRIAHIDFRGLPSRYPYLMMLPQPDTESILTDCAVARDVKVERNTELIGIEQDSEKVAARLRHEDGSVETVACGWLAGCDGAHSTVRHLLDLAFTGATYVDEFLLADVHVSWPQTDDEFYIYVSDDGLMAVFPLGEGRHRIIADNVHASEDGDDPTLEQLQAIVDRRGPDETVLSAARWLAYFRVNQRMVAQLRSGRSFVIGDAAHIHSPAGAQGMNTGIQDACNLAWKLALVARGRALPSLLDSYREERHPVEKSVLRASDFMTKIAAAHNPVLRFARDHLAPLLTGREMVQEYIAGIISELAVSYAGSSIVEEHKLKSGPSAGERAPDIALPSIEGRDPVRLYELLRNSGHQLLLFEGDANAPGDWPSLIAIADEVVAYEDLVHAHLIARTAPTRGQWHGSIYLDPDLTAHSLYGGGNPCLYLIRPDGYVAFRGELGHAAELLQYLRRMFPKGP